MPNGTSTLCSAVTLPSTRPTSHLIWSNNSQRAVNVTSQKLSTRNVCVYYCAPSICNGPHTSVLYICTCYVRLRIKIIIIIIRKRAFTIKPRKRSKQSIKKIFKNVRSCVQSRDLKQALVISYIYII